MNWTRPDLEGLIRSLVYPDMQRLKRRVLGLAVRGFVALVQDDAKTQRLQVGVLDGEVHDDVEHFQDYGFTSVPMTDAEAVVLSLGGSRSHTICIRTNDPRYRPTGLKPGDVAQYDHRGQIFTFTAEGVTLESSLPVTVKAPLLNVGEGAADAPVLVAKLASAIDAWTPVPNDGGAALKAALMTALTPMGGAPAPVASTLIKAN